MPLSDTQKAKLVDVYRRAEAAGDQPAMDRARQILADDRAAYANAAEVVGSPEWKAAGEAQAKGLGRSVLAGIARVPIGAGQLVTAARELIPGQEGALEEYNQAATEFLDTVRGRKYDGEIWSPEVVFERGTELAVGIPLAAGAKTLQLWEVVKGAARMGALGGAVAFDENVVSTAEKAGSAALGATVGAVLGGAAIGGASWIKQGLPQAFVRRMSKDVDEAQVQAAAELQRDFPELADLLTIGQRTGAMDQVKTEAKVAANYAMRAYREQAEALERGLRAFGEKYGAAWDPAELAAQAATRGPQVIREAVADLAKIRKAEFQSMMTNARTAVTTGKIARAGVRGSEEIPLPLPGFDDELTKLVEEFGISKADLGPALQRLRMESERFGGSVSAETFISTLEKLNTQNWRAAKLPEDVQRAFARRARDMLFDQIETMDPAVGDAVTWIKRARDSYRQRSSQLQGLRKSRVAHALGLETPNPAPEDALAAFRKASSGARIHLRHVLEKHDPELLNATRSLVWNGLLRDARTGAGSAAEAAFDPAVFQQTARKLFESEAQFGGLFSKTDAQEILKTLDNIRATSLKPGLQSQVADGEALSMISSSPWTAMSRPFQARYWWRLVGAKRFERMLFTTDGRAILNSVAQARDEPGFSAALGRATAWTSPDIIDFEGEDSE